MGSDDAHNLSSLISSEGRDFLIRNNGVQVKISSLIGKNVGLYFSASWCSPCRHFTPILAGVYEQLASKGDFEVIFVFGDKDEESFKDYFSKMPWLSIPFSDSETKKRLNELFKVRGIPHLVVLDPNGKVSTEQGVRLVSKHGVNAYPFTSEQIELLKEKDVEGKRNQTISSILGSTSRNYLISNDGNHIPVYERSKLVTPERYKKLVGISFHLHQMNMLLDLELHEVRCVGIVGMGGIGKTTIAEVLYDNISPKFRSNSCFLRISGQNLVSLQHQLLSELLWNENIKILHEAHGAQLIKNRLSSKKIIIVLDGVNEERQLEKLVGSLDWFGPGSRIIITTRNRNVLRQLNYKDKILEYKVELLDLDSAFLLLCKHAFGDGPPNDNYFMYLIKEMVKKLERHPLALTKIGSSLFGQGINVWEEKVRVIHELVRENIFSDMLKTSYEGLDNESQQIFLDLACFFNRMRVDRVSEILVGFGYSSPYTKIHLLADRCLIEIVDERIRIHILILSMGQGIARGEIATQQDKQTRIWLREDIHRVFHEKNGLKYIQGIVMDRDEEEEEELALEADSFTNLTELKILEINNVQLLQDIEFLSNQLLLLNWPGYPSKRLPSTFQPSSLLELHLPHSNVVQLWEGKKAFSCLKEIDASFSKYLVETPDFSNVPNLQRLILQNCVRLSVVHSSINSLNCLVLLDLEGCVSLKSFPSNMISCKSLEILILSNSGLERFPVIEGCMECLTELHLDGTTISELHHLSIGHLTGLTLLNLGNCTELSSLPNEMGGLWSLKTLILNGCSNLDQIPLSLGKIESLEKLDIGGTSISDAPLAIGSLCNLDILYCERLQRNIWHSLNALFGGVWSIRDLDLSDCNLVDEDIPDDLRCFSLLEILDLSGNHFVWLSESLTQLVNLKVLYLNDCVKLQQLPKLPASLQHVGGEKSFDMSQNYEGSSRSASSSSSPPNPLLMTKVDDLSKEIAEKECR